MYILKNAWLSITRNKGRNILIGIIILVISCACAITLAIKNSADTLITSYKEQYEVEATISTNRESVMGQMKPPTDGESTDRGSFKENFNNLSLTLEEVLDYADSEYVKSYYYTISSNADTDLTLATSSQSMGPKMNDSLTITGYSSKEAMTDFINGSATLTEGEITDNPCLISSELSTLNELEVGDTITIKNSDDEDVELIITGIYEQESNDDKMSMFSSSANNIITNAQTVTSLGNKTKVNPTFILTSVDDISKYEEELTSKGLSEYFKLSTNYEKVEESSKTISNVSTFAITFLIITLVIGSVVLFVINLINVRERKYEIGVLRTIGMKKSALTLQFTVELLIVTIISLLIGTGIGSTLSMPISNKLLEQEIASSETKKEEIKGNFGQNMPFDNLDKKISGVVEIEEFKSIDAVVNYKVLLEIILIGFGLTLLSSLASMISIQRFSPLTILKERS